MGTAPVIEGQRLTLVCESVGKKGDGMMKQDGFIIIVPQARLGKKYQIEVTKVLEKVAFGIMINEVNV